MTEDKGKRVGESEWPMGVNMVTRSAKWGTEPC